MKNVSGVSKGHFSVNFEEKKIVGSKASLTKASKGYGPLYDELVSLMGKHPTYSIEAKKPKKPVKAKRTYEGMDITFIQDFFSAIGLDDERDALDKALEYAGKHRISKYPIAKRMLFEVCAEFNYAEAKEEVRKYRYQRVLTESTAA